MTTAEKTLITIEATVNAPVEKVWQYWNTPEHITQWNQASDDWHCPWSKNDVREGGIFSTRMEAKDGSMGFEFGGVYDLVKPNERIDYTIGDGRKVQTTFTPQGQATKVVTQFEAEKMNPVELQRGGWQAILNSFKNYAETH